MLTINKTIGNINWLLFNNKKKIILMDKYDRPRNQNTGQCVLSTDSHLLNTSSNLLSQAFWNFSYSAGGELRLKYKIKPDKPRNQMF